MCSADLPGDGGRVCSRADASDPDFSDRPPLGMNPAPAHLDLKLDRGLTVVWNDGQSSYYSIAYLRRMSPSADMRQLRDEMKKNPLTVLPSGGAAGGASGGVPGGGGGLRAISAELVGNYAIKIVFSDGHSTGLYSWDYLRQIDPEAPKPEHPPEGASG